MPLDPSLVERFALLEGIDSFEEILSDPEKQQRLNAFGAAYREVRAPEVDVSEVVFDGPHGPIPARVYRPSAAAPSARPGLVWLHGGGFAGGSLDMPEADTVSREVSHRASAVVITVDYRLVTMDLHYPVPHDDVVAAWLSTVAGAADLGIDVARLSLGGGSAGANLAAGAALRLRDEQLTPPAALLLAYPLLHEALPAPSAELAAKLEGVPLLFRIPDEAVRFLNARYLGAAPRESARYAFPGDSAVDGLPPVLVLTSEYDDLRASGEEFARAVASAGGAVEVVQELGMMHGHLNLHPSLAAVDHSLGVLADAVASAGAVTTSVAAELVDGA